MIVQITNYIITITVTNGVIEDLPVLRPLIGMDKEDIMEISKKFNLYYLFQKFQYF